MNESDGDRLYNLLPEVYRIRDAESGYTLRALFSVLEEQFAALEQDIQGLYENWFIETCEEWVIPYIGALLRVPPLHTAPEAGIYSQRAYVANTLRYRRRKGTAAVLEQLARDITNWPARVVEYFQLLATTQYMNHIRPHKAFTIDMHDPEPLEILNTPFESAAHTVDIGHISSGRGQYNILNIGLHLWRLCSYPISWAEAQNIGDIGEWAFTINPLGCDTQLFNQPLAETKITHLAEEENVPGRLRRRRLSKDLRAYREALASTSPESYPVPHFLSSNVINVHLGDSANPLFPYEIEICDLTVWKRPPQKTYTIGGELVSSKVAIDPEIGRLVVLEGVTPPDPIRVSYSYGFSADIGGGPYVREDTTTDQQQDYWQRTVARQVDADYETIAGALQELAGTAGINRAVITILDSGTYAEQLSVQIPDGLELIIRAVEGHRPLVRLVNGTGDPVPFAVSGSPEDGGILTLDGLLVEGWIEVNDNVSLTLRHCTLVPGVRIGINGMPEFSGQPSLVISPGSGRVVIDHSIVGALRIPGENRELEIADSIVQGLPSGGDEPWAIVGNDIGDLPGPKSTIARSTIFGKIFIREICLATDSIFNDIVECQRLQVGCVRFSYVPYDSKVPRRYRCQPAMALKGVEDQDERKQIIGRIKPTFTSTKYNEPGYAQLSRACAIEIQVGGEDGSEMGVFNHLKQPQRETSLRAALALYLRFGLEMGIFYET